MTVKQVVTLVDDTDGSEASETVRFGLDKGQYEIDLSELNASALRNALREFVNAARKVTAPASPKKAYGTSRRSEDIRAWAKAKGLAINERGRIPADIVAKWELDTLAATHPNGQAAQSPAEPASPAPAVTFTPAPQSPAEPVTATRRARPGPAAQSPAEPASPAPAAEPAPGPQSPAEPATAPAGNGSAGITLDTTVIRGWAKRKGYKVSGYGKIPQAVIAEYVAAHPKGNGS